MTELMTMPVPLVFTDTAAAKVKELVAEESDPDLNLRIYINGGGCSGFQYGFSFDSAVSEGDMGVENQGVRLVVDSMSYQYLIGAEVDYVENLSGAQFVVKNPNATTTCGCGASFSI